MIYLDNAATTFPKPESVYNEINYCMRSYCANPGRSGHRMAAASSSAVMKTREVICSLFNINDAMQLCFTKNTTEALNIAIKGTLRKGDHVIISSMEHNAVIRPLKTMEQYDHIEITIIHGNEYGEIDVEDFRKNIKSNTRLIVCTLASNVNGMLMPIKELGKIAHENGIYFLIDGAQGAGVIDIDVEAMNIDLLAFPGHKGLFGPQGTGGLYVRKDLKLKPLMQGGTGSNSENLYQPDIMPDALESGTLNTPGIVGLGAGVNFIQGLGLENIRFYKHGLVSYFMNNLKSIRGVRVYSKDDINKNCGIIAVNLEGYDSAEVSNLLDSRYGIAVRGGLHCAMLAHETIKTADTGVVRFSMSCFNTIEDIDAAIKALSEIEQVRSCR